MSDKKDKNKKRSTTDTARRIWLAGVGAYGRAFTEAQEAIKDMSGETSRVFDELVQKGEFIEMAVDKKRKEIVGKAGMPDISMPDISLPDLNMDERIAKMRSRLMRGEDVAENISGLDERLTAIEAKLDKVLAALEGTKAPAKKPAAKKPAAKKTTTKRTPKPKS